MTSPAVAYFSKDPRSFWSIFCWIFPAGLFPPFQTAVEHWMQDIGSGEDGEMNPVSKYEEHIETCRSMLFFHLFPLFHLGVMSWSLEIMQLYVTHP